MVSKQERVHQWSLDKWQEKKIVVFGIGASGTSALKLLKFLEVKAFVVNKGEKVIWQKDILDLGFEADQLYEESAASGIMANADLIVLSPGIPRSHPQLFKALEGGVPIWSEIELAYHWVKHAAPHLPIIAITGTNGKTTTVSMVSHLFKATGRSIFIGGNIGVPFADAALQILKGNFQFTAICLELSSFQIESLENFRANVAAILNISLNHGERYQRLEEYAEAKLGIAKNMKGSDILIVPQEDYLSWPKHEMLKNWPVSLEKISIENAKNAVIEKFGKVSQELGGMHNWKNLLFALHCLKVIDPEFESQSAVMLASLSSFKFYPFRIQKIECNQNFQAFNDAKSTNWDATLNAVKNFQGSSHEVALIVGGQFRDEAKTLQIPEEIKEIVKKIYLIGETTEILAENFSKSILTQKSYTLEKAINQAVQDNFAGILLFSPGFQSFDQFKNYQDRGETFTKLIKNL